MRVPAPPFFPLPLPPPPPSRYRRVLLLDADCALVGAGSAKLEALLSLPHDLVVNRYPLGRELGRPRSSSVEADAKTTATGVHADTDTDTDTDTDVGKEFGGGGGLWVNSAAMLVRSTPWTHTFIDRYTAREDLTAAFTRCSQP